MLVEGRDGKDGRDGKVGKGGRLGRLNGTPLCLLGTGVALDKFLLLLLLLSVAVSTVESEVSRSDSLGCSDSDADDGSGRFLVFTDTSSVLHAANNEAKGGALLLSRFCLGILEKAGIERNKLCMGGVAASCAARVSPSSFSLRLFWLLLCRQNLCAAVIVAVGKNPRFLVAASTTTMVVYSTVRMKHKASAETPTTRWNILDLDLFLGRSEVLLLHVAGAGTAGASMVVMVDSWGYR